jgi:hypothetical protein
MCITNIDIGASLYPKLSFELLSNEELLYLMRSYQLNPNVITSNDVQNFLNNKQKEYNTRVNRVSNNKSPVQLAILDSHGRIMWATTTDETLKNKMGILFKPSNYNAGISHSNTIKHFETSPNRLHGHMSVGAGDYDGGPGLLYFGVAKET